MGSGVAGDVEAIREGEHAEASTPIELIRQKETELSGRVLAAKREADEIVADARKQAVAIVESATAESVADARERATKKAAEADAQAKTLIGEAEQDATALTESIQTRIDAAVDFITKSVVGD
jgi:vacuolar-type H+-ATPase subunit H